MDLPQKRSSPTQSQDFPILKKPKISQKQYSCCKLPQALWFSILSYLPTNFFFQTVPQISKSFFSLVEKYVPKLKSLNITIYCNWQSQVNNISWINRHTIIEVLSNNIKLTKLAISMSSSYSTQVERDVYSSFKKLPLRNTLKSLTIKNYWITSFKEDYFLLLFNELKSLKLMFTIIKPHEVNEFITLLNYSPDGFQSKKLLDRLERFTISFPLHMKNQPVFSLTSQMVKGKNLSIVDIKQEIGAFEHLENTIFDSFNYSFSLKELHLPIGLRFTSQLTKELCSFLNTSKILMLLYISNSVCEHQEFINAISYNKTLESLHLLGYGINSLSPIFTLQIFPALEKTNIKDFLLITTPNPSDLASNYSQYFESLDHLLKFSKVVHASVHLSTKSLNVMKRMIRLIFEHCQKQKLESYFQINIKQCAKNNVIPVPKLQYIIPSVYYYEVVRKLIKNTNKMMRVEHYNNDYESYISQKKKNSIISDSEEFFKIIPAIKYNKIQKMNLTNLVIMSYNITFLKILKNLTLLEALKVKMSDAHNRPDILIHYLAKYQIPIKDLSIIYTKPSFHNIVWPKPDLFKKISLSTTRKSSSEKDFYEVFKDLNSFKLEWGMLKDVELDEILKAIEENPFLTKINLCNINLNVHKEVEYALKALNALQLHENVRKIYISWSELNFFFRKIDDFYTPFIECVKEIVAKNSKLFELSIHFPVYSYYIHDYSLEMLKVLKENSSIKVLNGYKIDSFFNDIFDKTISSSNESFEFLSKRFFTGPKRMECMMPIILSEILKRDNFKTMQSILSSTNIFYGTIDLSTKFLNENPFLSLLNINCLSIFTSAQKLKLGDRVLSYAHIKSLKTNLGYLYNLTQIKLCNLSLKLSKFSWVLSAPNLTTIVICNVVFKFDKFCNRFCQAFQTANISSLGLLNVRANPLDKLKEVLSCFDNKFVRCVDVAFTGKDSLIFEMIKENKILANATNIIIDAPIESQKNLIGKIIDFILKNPEKIVEFKFSAFVWKSYMLTSENENLLLRRCILCNSDLLTILIMIENGILRKISVLDLEFNIIDNVSGMTVYEIIKMSKPDKISLAGTNFEKNNKELSVQMKKYVKSYGGILKF